MSESTQPDQAAVGASFAAHIQAFHGTLPPEEQTLLEQVFALAESASQEQTDVQGFGGTPVSLPSFKLVPVKTISWAHDDETPPATTTKGP